MYVTQYFTPGGKLLNRFSVDELTVVLEGGVVGLCPECAVDEYLSYVFVLERGNGLVTGTEVENFAVASSEGAAASEYLAAGEPAYEYKLVGSGMSKCSPYISSMGSSKYCGMPLAMG